MPLIPTGEETWSSLDKNVALMATFDAIPSMITYWDKHCICRFANRIYKEWFGISPEDMIGMHLEKLLGSRQFSLSEKYVNSALRGEKQQFERRSVKADGSIGYSVVNYIPDFAPDGSVVGFLALANDVTPLKRAQEDLIDAQARLHAIVDSVMDCVVAIDKVGTIESVNLSTLSLFNYRTEELVGQNIQILLGEPPGPRRDAELEHDSAPIDFTKTVVARETLGATKEGRRFPIELKVTKAKIASEDLFVVVIRDITEQKLAQKKLTRVAMTDGLTDLANRRRFDEVLTAEYIKHSLGDARLSLLMIEVDYFKAFNDAYGHLAGDDCLRKVARVLEQSVRRGGDLVARFGGEEFACVLPLTDHRSAVDLAESIRRQIDQLQLVHDPSVTGLHVTVSIGIATSRCAPGGSAMDLLAAADDQLYQAKASGRNRCVGVEL